MKIIHSTLVLRDVPEFRLFSINSHNRYMDFLFAYGMFRREELPDEAVEVYEVSHYEGEVMNGGHAQYLSNGDRWREIPGTIGNACLSGLKALSSDFHLIYEQFHQRIVHSTSDLMKSMEIGNLVG